MALEKFTLPAFAKINWLLRVLGKREDGFHELCTIFQTVSLCDELSFEESDSLVLTSDDENLPVGESNLIIKAARFLKEKFNIQTGAKIHLRKQIPAPGGLGGGSSDGAVALLGLAKLWNLQTGASELLEIGEKLGSDVPFFFFGGTGQGTGRGTEIIPLKDLTGKFLLIVTPGMAISTPEAFARLKVPRLTKESSKSILKICQFEAQNFKLGQSPLINDFEKSVFEFEPEIRRVKEKLLALGAREAMMSGSGASVFAIFDKTETRQTTLKALDEEKNWRKFAVATVSRSEYREALEPCRGLLPISF